MKKVLIISYFFPPSNFVGAERTFSWAQNLHKNNIYPVIVTRCWNDGQKDIVDKVEENVHKIEKNEFYEVHYLPYNQSLRDKLSDYPSLKVFQKALSLIELIFSNFVLRLIPYNNLYFYSKELLRQDKDIKIVIASGRPFQSFYFGYLLKKQFPIKWIPDYRDEWNTHQNNDFTKSFIHKFISKLEAKSELKWTSNADAFISVSDYWVNQISNFIDKDGVVIMNGYNKLNPLKNSNQEPKLKIVYAGTLYESQKIELFIDSCKSISKMPEYTDAIEVTFIGIELQAGTHSKILKLISGFEHVFRVLPRLPKNELNTNLENSDVLLMTGFENVKGWYPVKLFEYFATNKPILLFPSDRDVIENFIIDTGSGFVVNTVEEGKELLVNWIQNKRNNIPISLTRNDEKREFFSRSYQNNLLGEFLNKI
ncbi:MAG: hypothetical protein RL264_2283 [Bacteroidota bacterium]